MINSRIFGATLVVMSVAVMSARAAEGLIPVYDPQVEGGRYILTPKESDSPRINAAAVFGVRPGSPFLFTIAATGRRPMDFSAKSLPDGLKLDKTNGQITGVIKSEEKRDYEVVLTAANAIGKAEKKFTIKVGDEICLTPPLGWNSWNCWGGLVSQEKVLSSAKAMVDKGLINHGWTYMNIDDGWQGVRGGKFNAIQPNKKFPDMKALADEIHGMGLKLGTYSTPWQGTYEGHIGSSCDNEDGTYDWIKAGKHNEFYKFEKASEHYKFGKFAFVKADADQWAAWGVDYLKYDWTVVDPPHVKEMSDVLRKSGRDIVYSLSNSSPINDAAAFAQLANAWRTTGDISDNWLSLLGIGFSQNPWQKFAGPGHWNDPDMLVVGSVGWGQPHPSNLTPDEQYMHLSLWSLLAAPLLIGCDLAQLDDFTLNLLANDEVLAVDQDVLGKQGWQVSNSYGRQVWMRPLEDGSVAVGLFNLNSSTEHVSATWKELELKGRCSVRDLWRQKDIGVFDEVFHAMVRPHGAILVKLSKATETAAAASEASGVKLLPEPPVIAPEGGIQNGGGKEISITSSGGNAGIHFTIDGSEPTKDSPAYVKPFVVDHFTIVKAVRVMDGKSSYTVTQSYYIPVKEIPEPAVKLSELKAEKATTLYGTIGVNRSIDGNTLTLNGKKYANGMGVHAKSEMEFMLDSSYKRFVATVGVDDETNGKGSVKFEVVFDGKLSEMSPILKSGQTWNFDIQIPAGAKKILLIADHGGAFDFDHADWAGSGFAK